MVSVCFCFQVHQPFRLGRYRVFDIGVNSNYFDEKKNMETMQKVAKKCYLPANKTILDLISQTDGKFRVSYSITGMAIEQFQAYSPEVLDSFRELSRTGCVEFLDETYYHSLSFLYSKEEFREQVKMHNRMVKRLFNFAPKIFRNTELIYNNELANYIEKLGYKAILAEGADHILGWRSPNFIYKSKTTNDMRLLLKNYRLSDDIAFRFSERSWEGFPLTAPKFARWVDSINGNGNVVNLFMDYETFGEHQWEDKGIFEFLRHLPSEILKHPDNSFLMLNEAVQRYEPVAELDIHNIISWADVERDLSAWLGNKMQQEAIKELYLMEMPVKNSKDNALLESWRKLQTSDHFYYMCTKWFNDGDVHKYFNPYDSPYESFIAFMNIINDLKIRLNAKNDASQLTEIKQT
ncbi:glycoside hydrolase family 57 protein [Candidatus Woesearchaeota archaeon]|nr:glycoside hydrolase family 57 protein [Candidatus Woesearchaeota archaeon]